MATSTRQKDVKTWLLGTTVNVIDKTITSAKLPTYKQVLVAFLARLEEDKLLHGKTQGKFLHKAALSTVEEDIVPIYGKAKVKTKSVSCMTNDVLKFYSRYDKAMKVPTARRDKPTGLVVEFKNILDKTMVLWCPKEAAKHEDDKTFLENLKTDRTFTMGGVDKIDV